MVFPYVKSSLQATSELNKLKFESSQWSGLNIMILETAEYNSEEEKGGMPRYASWQCISESTDTLILPLGNFSSNLFYNFGASLIV